MSKEIEEIFIENNTCYLKGEVTRKKALEFIFTIKENDINELDLYISIDSIDCMAAFMIYDFLKTSGIKVNTCAIGYLGEYAFLIFLAGETRKALAHSVIRVPRFNFNLFDSSTKIRSYVEYKEKIIKNIKGVYKEVTNTNPPKDLLKEDLRFSAKEMVSKKIATEVVS